MSQIEKNLPEDFAVVNNPIPSAPSAPSAPSFPSTLPEHETYVVAVAVPVENDTTTVAYQNSPPVETIQPTNTPISTNVEASTIPDEFTKCSLLCCACRFDNCDFPKCWGYKGNCQCLCCEEESFCCKYISGEERTCCILLSRSLECITCATACKCYRQCCCCEVIWGFPFETAYSSTPIMFKSIPNRDGSSAVTDAIVFQALFCIINSCYFNFPECCSGYQKASCLCLESEAMCCRMMCCSTTKEKKNSLCIIDKGHCFLVCPKACCKGVSQLFCFDQRCAIPCDQDVPCAFTLLPFCTICVNFGCNIACCTPIGRLTNQSK